MNIKFKQDEIILLVGAGASVDANIPDSTKMINEIERLLIDDESWKEFSSLYNFIKSSIYYSDGIQGKFNNDVNFNIERLVNTLEEIRKKNQHTLYPFVGSWNPTLIEVAGNNFKMAEQLKNKTIETLRDRWIALENKADAEYYKGIINFQAEYQFPLRIFSLNYDLCIEKICGDSNPEYIERGFDENCVWHWQRFIEIQEEPNIYLYKLHGSNDWKYEENSRLIYRDAPSTIPHIETAIIFGDVHKLQYIDPFLFLVYEFRKWSLESKMILSIGYGFGDDHINGILSQALNLNENRRLVSISPGNPDEKEKEICDKLGISKDRRQVKSIESTAKKFLMNNFTVQSLSEYLPEEEELFPDLLAEEELNPTN